MDTSTFTAQTRARRISPALVVAFTIFAMLAYFFPGGVGPAEADPEEKCTTYYFEYTDGDVDSGEICDGPVTEIYDDVHGIHVPNLHISCSDTFSTPVEDEEGNLLGYDSDGGTSDLGGHLIAVEDGVAQWGIQKSWTGDGGLDCGFFIPPPPPPVCEGTIVVEVRDATSNELVTVDGGESTVEGSLLDLEADGTTDVPGTFECDEVSGTLDTAPDGYDIVDGSDSATIDENGEQVTLVFTVTQTPPPPPPECEGTIVVEVRDATSNELVTVDGGESTVEGSLLDLEADGTTDVPGTFDCDEVSGTLDTAPDGYDIVDGSDSATIDENGEQVTLAFTVTQTPPPPPPPVCEGPVMVEVHEDTADGPLVGGGESTVEGDPLSLDSDGTTDAGEFDCETVVDGTLDTPPTGYTILDGEDQVTVDEDGETLIFIVEEVPTVTEVCEGALEIVVIGPDGNAIDGPVDLDNVEIVTTYTDDSVECATYTVTLDEDALAEGVSLGTVSNTDDADAEGPVQIVTVQDGDEDRVVFELVQVEGVTVERPPQPAPDAPEEPQTAPEELARTGAHTQWLLMLALLALLGGTAFLRVGDRRDGELA